MLIPACSGSASVLCNWIGRLLGHVKILAPAFYALNDARTPMAISLSMIVVNFGHELASRRSFAGARPRPFHICGGTAELRSTVPAYAPSSWRN